MNLSTGHKSRLLALRSIKPFSFPDVGLSFLILGCMVAVWFVGDFHALHHGDSVIFSLNSLYQWTPFLWEYDHGGMLLPLLVTLIKRPYLNLILLSAISSLMFLGGLAVWASLLSFRSLTLAESSLWVGLLTPLVLQKSRIFANAAPGVTSGNAFFFGGVFMWAMLRRSEAAAPTRKWLWAGAMIAFGFLAIYLSKLMFIPLAVVALLSHKPVRFAPLVCLAVALAALQLLELAVPYKNDYSFNILGIPNTFWQMFGYWLRDEVTSPLWILAPLALWFYPPARKHPLLITFALGVVAETIIISSSRWVVANQFVSRYLYDLLFFTVLAALIVVADLVRRFKPAAPIVVAIAALLLNAYEWNSFRPSSPFAQLDRTIGRHTTSILEADCDVLIGDFWRVWPAALAVNDYYARGSTRDPRTGRIRLVAGIALRAWPTEHLWRPRLDWPDVKLCSFEEDARVQRAIQVYAPDIILLLTPKTRVGSILLSQLENRRLPYLGFEFDNVAPGAGWHGQESTPDGQTFQWMKEQAELVLPLATDRDFLLRFRVRPALAPGILPGLTLAVNGHPVTLISRPEANSDTTFEAAIPKTLLDNPRYTRLVFRVSHTVIPDDLYGNGDTRALGLAFDWLRLDPINK